MSTFLLRTHCHQDFRNCQMCPIQRKSVRHWSIENVWPFACSVEHKYTVSSSHSDLIIPQPWLGSEHSQRVALFRAALFRAALFRAALFRAALFFRIKGWAQLRDTPFQSCYLSQEYWWYFYAVFYWVPLNIFII